MSKRCLPCVALLFLFGCDDGRTNSTDGGTDAYVVPNDCELPAPIDCAMDLGARFPVDLTTSTAETSDGHGGPSCGGGGGVNDVSFQWTAPRAGRYEITTEGTAFDTVISVVRGGCLGGEEIACNDDVDGSQQARISMDLAECETVRIIVDGFGRDDVGDVRFRIRGREEACSDGLDDDADGLIDCDDADDCRVRECIEDGDWPAPWAALEWRVLELTNENRARGASCGGEPFPPAGPLEMDEVIRVAARLHSTDMGEQDYFMHDSLDGRTFADRMRDAGFSGPSPWGENIAAGQPTAESVVQGWMESPGHCRNIMNPDYHVIGIGYSFVEPSTFGHYWTQDFAGGH